MSLMTASMLLWSRTMGWRRTRVLRRRGSVLRGRPSGRPTVFRRRTRVDRRLREHNRQRWALIAPAGTVAL